MVNVATSKESKDSAGLLWILAIFFSWISSLIFYITKKDDAFVHAEAKLALNLSINYIIVCIAISILMMIAAMISAVLAMIIYLLFLVAFIGWIIICMKCRKAALDGTAKPKIPYAIMFIK